MKCNAEYNNDCFSGITKVKTWVDSDRRSGYAQVFFLLQMSNIAIIHQARGFAV